MSILDLASFVVFATVVTGFGVYAGLAIHHHHRGDE